MDEASDRVAIVDLLNLYGVAVDARRWDLMGRIFAPGARLRYFDLMWDDLASFRNDFERAHEDFSVTQHRIGNHVVSLAGDAAAALSYCDWRLVRTGTPGGDAWWGAAWYNDALARLSGGWRIVWRDCGLLWTEGNPLVAGAGISPAPRPLHEAVFAALDGVGHG